MNLIDVTGQFAVDQKRLATYKAVRWHGIVIHKPMDEIPGFTSHRPNNI